MKQIYKNPALYYILVPIIVALWPLFICGVYLPEAETGWQSEKSRYTRAQKIMAGILELDPDRLGFADAKAAGAEFDYASAVEKTARLCKISSSDYKLSSGIVMTSSGQKSQKANVVLRDIELARFARFLSTIQLHWPSLQCERVKLTGKKGVSDRWNIELDFKYYY